MYTLLLHKVEKSLTSITLITSDTATAPSDTCLLHQYEERANNINRDLVKTRNNLHMMELAYDNKLFELQDSLECQLFNYSVTINKLLSLVSGPSGASPTSDGKLLKLDIVYLSFVLFNTSHGNLFQNVPLTLVDCVKLLSRV